MKHSNKRLHKDVDHHLQTVQEMRLAALCKKIEKLSRMN